MYDIITFGSAAQDINLKSKAFKVVKDQKDFYTNFAEIEVEVEEILYLMVLIFKYMPANVDVIYPEIIALTNNGWGDILNELVRRLHRYDEIARVIEAEKVILEKKLRELMNEKVREK